MILSLPLKKSLNVKRRTLTSVDPFIYCAEFVEASDQTGLTGYGEVIQSRNLAKELACLHLKLLENGFDIKPRHEKIPVAGMMDNLTPESITEAQDLVAHGFRTLKLKVGKNWAHEAEVLQEIRLQVGLGIDIRLDANRALKLSDAVQFGKRVADLRIAYFEEPLCEITQIPEFFQKTGISVALDETLLEDVPILEGVSTYALKPFLMPNLNRVFECIQQAEDHGVDVAICSAFESPYSLNWLVLLAAMIQGKLLPAGLSTYRWFENQSLIAEFSVKSAIESLSLGKPTQNMLLAS
jgi:o-succinylbenzoate synthase